MKVLVPMIVALQLAAVAEQGSAQSTATVDFESLAAGTRFGGSAGDSPGDIVFNEDGIDVSVETDLRGSFSSVEIGGFTASSFPTTSATIGNINLGFDLTNLVFGVRKVTFEYVDSGGDENLGVNGTVVQLGRLSEAPTELDGVGVSVTESVVSGRLMGTVTLSGSIDSVIVGGQEFGMDNFIASSIPEPGTICLALLSISAVFGRCRLRAIRI